MMTEDNSVEQTSGQPQTQEEKDIQRFRSQIDKIKKKLADTKSGENENPADSLPHHQEISLPPVKEKRPRRSRGLN